MYTYSKPIIINTSVEQISKEIRAAACSVQYEYRECFGEALFCNNAAAFGSEGSCPSWNPDKCDPLNGAGEGHGTYPTNLELII